MGVDRSGPSVAETVAAAIAGFSPARIPSAMRRVGEDLLLDVLGLCLAARRTDYVRALIAGLDGDGTSTAIGQRRRLTAAGAALVNGTAAHGEDFDDTFEGGPVTAGAAVVPPVWPPRERRTP